MKNITKDNKGFTIIEVLIVLAIAGLIMLVVFLAVPALQRNSRNTQRKSDVSALAGAVQEYAANNGGAPLTTATVPTAVKNAKLGFYTPTTVFANNTGGAPTSASSSGTGNATTLTTSNVIIWVGYDCSGGGASAPVAGAARSTAIEYAIEDGSGTPIVQCTQS